MHLIFTFLDHYFRFSFSLVFHDIPSIDQKTFPLPTKNVSSSSWNTGLSGAFLHHGFPGIPNPERRPQRFWVVALQTLCSFIVCEMEA
jgi:hypothetical protein